MDFVILHLSDLHITNTDGTYPKVLDHMLSDIKEQCSKYETIIIVVSGDIIDRASYSDEMNNIIIDFFKSLRQTLESKKVYIEFVPGNHDKKQSMHDQYIIDNYIGLDKEINMTDEEWSYNLIAYKHYLNLLNIIVKLFDNQIDYFNNTYYIDVVELFDSKIIFINLDTSWSSKSGEGDKGNLRIIRSHLDTLKRQYRKIVSNSSKDKLFTICIAHHPLNWLKARDEALLNSWFLDEEYFNIDAFLCGHTHDRQINNFCNNINSYITLVTGIGWNRQSAEESKENHRYSIYHFNTNNKVCEVKIRKTKSLLRFDDDHDILLTNEERDSKKILIPLSPHKMYPYLKIPIYNDSKLEFEYRFINNNIASKIIQTSTVIFDMGLHMQKYLEMYIKNFFIQYELFKTSRSTIDKYDKYDDYFYKGIETKEISILFDKIKNKKFIYENFISYLQQFCEYFSYSLIKMFPECIGIRCHFRHCYISDNNSILYITFCQGSDSSKSLHSLPEIRDIDYTNSLIECSFLTKSSLVYIHNTKHNTLKPKEWGNFITIVPNIKNNEREYQIGINHEEQISIPIITCAISTKDNLDSTMLDILNYMQINKIIERVILNYTKLFHIDFDSFINYLENNNLNKGDSENETT